MLKFIASYHGGLIVGAIVVVILCLVQSNDANKDIHSAEEQLGIPGDFRRKSFHTAPIGGLVFVLIILFIALITPYRESDDKYESLEEKYTELEMKYDNLQSDYAALKDSIQLAYDDAMCVRAYFLGWDEAPFELGKQSIKNIYDRLYPGEW